MSATSNSGRASCTANHPLDIAGSVVIVALVALLLVALLLAALLLVALPLPAALKHPLLRTPQGARRAQ
jgi:hypothetical protein